LTWRGFFGVDDRIRTGFPFGISQKARRLSKKAKAVIAHIEEVMAHPLIGWIAAIARASAKTRRHLHGMDEQHTEHVDIEVDRCFHVVGAEREVMNAARSRGTRGCTHVSPPVL
jgi:hypothetical protein